jgi:ankyrin repeat protein
MVKALLAAGVNPNATNRYSTPLTSAAYRGNQEVVALLLSQPGIKVDARDVDGYTSLMWAAEQGSLDLVDLLMKAGACPSLKNQRGETAISLAEQGIAKRRAIISKLGSKPK